MKLILNKETKKKKEVFEVNIKLALGCVFSPLSFISSFADISKKSFQCAVTNITLPTRRKINHAFKWRQMPHPPGVAAGYSHNGLFLSASLYCSFSQGGEFPWTRFERPGAQQPYAAQSHCRNIFLSFWAPFRVDHLFTLFESIKTYNSNNESSKCVTGPN